MPEDKEKKTDPKTVEVDANVAEKPEIIAYIKPPSNSPWVLNWQWSAFVIQMVLTAFLIGTFIYVFPTKGKEIPIWYVFMSNLLCLFIAGINCMLISGIFRKIIALIIIITVPFMLPMAIFMCLERIDFAFAISMIFVIGVIATSPLDIGICVFISSLLFVPFQKIFFEIPEFSLTITYFVRLIIAYCAVGILAILWRYFFAKFYEFLFISSEKEKTSSETPSEDDKKDDANAKQELNMLRKAVSVHIAKFNNLVAYKYEKNTGKDAK